MPDNMRPDRVHLYASGKQTDEGLKIVVDADYPEAWRTGTGADVVNHFLNKGFHLIVVTDKQINFLKGKGRAQPEKLLVDWLL